MPSDADRFRPREQAGLVEHSPTQPPHGAPSAFGADYGSAPQPGVPPQYVLPQQIAPHYAPPNWAAPRYTSPHYAAGFDGHDAPLIHPAAAQTSSITPYGVPVYRTPGYPLPAPPARGLSITALVLGLCSFVFAWIFVVVPIIGLVFGFLALRREPAGRTMAIVGLVASAVGMLWVLLFYLLPFLGFFGAMLFATTG